MRILLCVLLSCLMLPVSGYAQKDGMNEEIFTKVKFFSVKGGKAKEVEVRLRFSSAALSIEGPKSGEVFKEIKYAQIKELSYSHSRQPRAKAGAAAGGAAAATVIGVLAHSVPVAYAGFAATRIALAAYKHKGKAHWLTVRGAEEYAVFHLNDNNFRVINAAIAAKSGVRVDLAPEDDK